jgi:hypothetical protein
MKNKYLILERHIFDKSGNVKDMWNVKYADQSYEQAFEKLVCLERLKEDKDKIYYLMPCNHLWTNTTDVKKESEKIKTATQETNQEELPF